MESFSESYQQILNLLKQTPLRIEKIIDGIPLSRLDFQLEDGSWSVRDILAHLRACADVWGDCIRLMTTQSNPSIRYRSPRLFMKKTKYQDEDLLNALKLFIKERQSLVELLENLDDDGWQHQAILTGTTPRQRKQTVFSYAQRMVNHEQEHLAQIEKLLG